MAFQITKALAAAFACDWYNAVDSHTPVQLLMERTVGSEFRVHFPGRDLRYDDFLAWYENDIHTHFDGRHRIHSMEIETTGDQAVVLLQITWKARRWTPPAAYSEEVTLTPDVTMHIEACGEESKILLRSYHVADREAET